MKGLVSLILYVMAATNPAPLIEHDSQLCEKIGQMLLIGFDGKTADKESIVAKQIQTYNIGGVILFDYDQHTKTYDKNIESPSQVKALTHDLQRAAAQGHIIHHRPQLPLIVSVDYEGGKVNRLDERYGFPATQSAADIGRMPLDAVEPIAEIMATTLEDLGFNLNFAPVLDVNVNPTNPIIGAKDRSFSNDPYQVSRDAEIFSRHFLNKHIECAYKHFPGHGSATGDSHLGFVDVTDTWTSDELEPYWLAFGNTSSCGVVMTAHVVNRQLDESGLPATLSHKILTGLLREQLHFEGVIITDDMQMKAIRDHYGVEEAITLAINAGADMLIFSSALPGKKDDPGHIIDIIEAKVASGEISASRIEDAYQHILALKLSITRQ